LIIALAMILCATETRAQSSPTSTITSTTVEAVPTSEELQPIEEPATVRPEDARSWEQPPGVLYSDILMAVPRVVLFVPKLVLNLIMYPFKGALWLINEYNLIEEVEDLLYNDERTAAILPLVIFLPGQGLRLGLTAFHDDIFGNGEQGAISGKWAGADTQSYELSLEGDTFGGSRLWLETKVRYELEPGLYFSGIGIPQGEIVDTRFSQDRLLGKLRLGTTYGDLGERFKIGGAFSYNHRRFDAAKKLGAGDRSIEQVYDTTLLSGFENGVDIFELTAELVLDYRDRAGFTSNGFYLEAFGGGAPNQSDDFHYFHYGAEAIAYINLYKRTRVLVLRAVVEAVEGEYQNIPFSELPRLGGADRLRGYHIDSFRDEKALLGSVEYHYPIHRNLAGELFFDIGTVARNYDELFQGGTDDWKIGYGAGLLLGSEDKLNFRFDVSYGDGLRFFLSTDIAHAFNERIEEL
jgi:hypothetical protein